MSQNNTEKKTDDAKKEPSAQELELQKRVQFAAANIISEEERRKGAYIELEAWKQKYKVDLVPYKIERLGQLPKWGIDIQFL